MKSAFIFKNKLRDGTGLRIPPRKYRNYMYPCFWLHFDRLVILAPVLIQVTGSVASLFLYRC